MKPDKKDYSEQNMEREVEGLRQISKPHVLMAGPARSVHGGISAVVNSLYESGLGERVSLRYIGTMVDGSKLRKLIRFGAAFLLFAFNLPWADAVHINMAADASFYRKKLLIDSAALFGKKIIIHEHGGNFVEFYEKTLDDAGRKMVQKTLQKADVFLVLSQQWKTFFDPIFGRETKVLHNGIRIPEQARENYDDRGLIFLGRICREKGIRELLSAMDLVHERVPDAVLHLGGVFEDPEFEAAVRRRDPYVKALGWVDADTRDRYLMEEDSIFVLPSYFEGQPISLLEAMAAGCVCVATKVGGIPEMMEDRISGVLLSEPTGGDEDPELVRELAEVMTSLLQNPQRKRELGQAARKKAEESYSIERVVDALEQFYWE